MQLKKHLQKNIIDNYNKYFSKNGSYFDYIRAPFYYIVTNNEDIIKEYNDDDNKILDSEIFTYDELNFRLSTTRMFYGGIQLYSNEFIVEIIEDNQDFTCSDIYFYQKENLNF